MTFLEPFWLPLAALPAVAVWLWRRRRDAHAVRFTGTLLLADLQTRPRRAPVILATVAATLLLVPYSEPRLTAPVETDRANVVLVLDVSGSMSATDVEPTRLAAAKAAAGDFVAAVPERWRVSVVAFSDQPFVVTAPTTDRAQVLASLQTLVAKGGTSTGDALSLAIDVGRAGSAERIDEAILSGDDLPDPASAVVVLLSDGAQTTGTIDALTAADRARRLGVPVHTIALGTEAGKIDVVFPDGVVRPLDVPPDLDTVSRIAELTGGTFFTAVDADGLRAVYASVVTTLERDRRSWDLTVAFVVAAVAAFAGAAVTGRTRRKDRR